MAGPEQGTCSTEIPTPDSVTSDHEPREPKVEPFAPDVEIRSYGDYRRHIRGHSAKSLQALYDDAYYRRHVGSKEHADVYFSTLGLGSTEFTVVPLELARPGPGDRVLDVGCGRGEMVFQSAARGAEVVGFDFSEAAIAIAEETRSRHDDEIQERTRFVRKRRADAFRTGFVRHGVPP